MIKQLKILILLAILSSKMLISQEADSISKIKIKGKIIINKRFKPIKYAHIVNLNKIHMFNSINIREGYSALEIRSPMEILYE